MTSQLISTSREIKLFQEDSIRSYLFIDSFLESKFTTRLVGYSLEIRTEQGFDGYISHIYKKLQKSMNFLRGYVKSLESGYAYNNDTNQFDKSISDAILGSQCVIIMTQCKQYEKLSNNEF